MDIKKTTRKQEKKEVLNTISNNNTTTTPNVTSNVTTFSRQIIPENGWAILAQFAVYKRSFAVNELYRMVGKAMHKNTIRSMVERLKDKSWIRIHGPKTGRTARENRYIITLDGLAVWEIYNAR